MWTILSRLYCFTYEMLFRISRRVYLIASTLRWTNPKPPILPPPPPSPSTTKYISIDMEGQSPQPNEINPLTLSNPSPLPIGLVTDKPCSVDVEMTFSEQGCVHTAITTVDQCQQAQLSSQLIPPVLPDLLKEDALALLGEKVQDSQHKPKNTHKVISKDRDKVSDLAKALDQEGHGSNSKSKNRRSKRKKNMQQNFTFTEIEVASTRPNFFVAFQVSNKDIKSKILEIQDNMLKKELTSPAVVKISAKASIFKETMVPVDKLHFTLHVFHLKEEEEQKKATEILERCFLKYKDEFEKEPMTVNIQGLGHFRNSVLFAKILGDENISRLESICDALRAEFDGMNIVGDSKVFKPHMTIAKMSRSKKLHKKRVRSFPLEMWSEFEAQHFGYQRVEGLQLLSMTESDPVTGYYRCVAQFNFFDPLSLNSAYSTYSSEIQVPIPIGPSDQHDSLLNTPMKLDE